MIDVVKRINDLLEIRNWSKYELANQTGISANSIYDWNKNKSLPTLKNIIKICDSMGISLEFFFCNGTYVHTDEERNIINNLMMLSVEDRELLIKFMVSLNMF